MVRDYELMYIVRPDLDDDAVRGATDSVQSLIEAQGGEVVKTTSWGKRRLAYEIQRLRDGHYMLLQLRLDGAKLTELERQLRIHDNVFRHMFTLYVEGAETEDGRREGRQVDGEAVLPDADDAVVPGALIDEDEEEV